MDLERCSSPASLPSKYPTVFIYVYVYECVFVITNIVTIKITNIVKYSADLHTDRSLKDAWAQYSLVMAMVHHKVLRL